MNPPKDRNRGAPTDPVVQPNDDKPVVLLVTGRLAIVEQVMTISAQLRVALLVAPRLTPMMRHHLTDAPVLLVGADVLPAVAGEDLNEHPGLVVVTEGSDPSAVETAELLLGSALVIWLPQASRWLTDRISAHTGGPYRPPPMPATPSSTQRRQT